MGKLKAVSLFSNCGAGDIGFNKAGFRFKVMAELDDRRLSVCLLNHPKAIGVPGDLRDTWSQVVTEYRELCGDESPGLLSACPPCQGMSSARSDRGRESDADAGSKDDRNLLVEVIADVALALTPHIIVVENVPAFLTRKVRHPETKKAISAANLLISRLNLAYEVYPVLADLCDFGVPQTRKRAFLTFIRRDNQKLAKFRNLSRIPFPRPTHAADVGGENPISISEALLNQKLPALDAKNSDLAESKIPMHFVPVWEARQYEMVKAIPINSGSSAWQNDACQACGIVKVRPEDVLCPICNEPLLRPIVKDAEGEYRFIKGFRTSSYRRMLPNRPSATVTTASGHLGSDNTIHPFENRILSPLECAFVQTFPSDFSWGDALEKWGHTNVRAMIGEAVPPRFTELHGRVLVGLLTTRMEGVPLSSNDERHLSAVKKLKTALEPVNGDVTKGVSGVEN